MHDFAAYISARCSLGRLRCVPTLPSPLHTNKLKVSVSVVLHAGEDRNPVQDGAMWDWFTPVGWTDSGDTPAEVTYPKRLVQQIESEEEMAHDRLDTRVKNSTGDTSVSCG